MTSSYLVKDEGKERKKTGDIIMGENLNNHYTCISKNPNSCEKFLKNCMCHWLRM